MATPAERAARERKQKLFVAVGGVVLLLLVGIQLPGYLGGGSSSSATGTTTEATTGAPSPTDTPPSGTTTIPASLRDTDRPLAAEPGKLRSFSSFSRRDPFVQQVDTSATAGGSSQAPPETGAGAKAGGTTQVPTKGFTVGGTTTAAVTVVSVNGRRMALEPGTVFPAADPAFVLVDERPAARAVVIGVAGGSFANGSPTATLRIGKPLVLENTTTGVRYRIVLVAVGDGSATEPVETEPARANP